MTRIIAVFSRRRGPREKERETERDSSTVCEYFIEVVPRTFTFIRRTPLRLRRFLCFVSRQTIMSKRLDRRVVPSAGRRSERRDICGTRPRAVVLNSDRVETQSLVGGSRVESVVRRHLFRIDSAGDRYFYRNAKTERILSVTLIISLSLSLSRYFRTRRVTIFYTRPVFSSRPSNAISRRSAQLTRP